MKTKISYISLPEVLKWHSVFVHFKQTMVPEIISKKTLYSIYYKVQEKYQQLCP